MNGTNAARSKKVQLQGVSTERAKVLAQPYAGVAVCAGSKRELMQTAGVDS